MDKEYYTSNEYKKVEEYKKMPAEDYRARREFFGNKRELVIVPEENHDVLSNRIKEAKKASAKPDDNGLKKILDKISTTSTSVVTSTAVVVAGAGAVAVAPEIIPDLPPIIPDIVPIVDISTGIIEIADEEEYIYTGSEIKPSVRLLIGGIELDSSNYQVIYINNINPGIATIKITPINDEYKGEVTLDFIILKDNNDVNIRYVDGEIVITSKYSTGTLKYYSDSECKVEINKPDVPGSYYVRAYIPEGDNHKEAYSNILSYIVPYPLANAKIRLKSSDLIYYTGSEIKPDFDLFIDDKLIEESNYNIEYVDNLNPGKAKIIVTALNEYYTGSKELEFVINKRINNVEIKYVNNEIVIDSLYGEGILKYYSDSECKNEIEKPTAYGHYFVRAYVVSDEYNLECASNILEYNISLDLADTTLEIINLGEYRYTGNEIKPLIKVLYNGLVVDPKLYKVEYINNRLPGMATIKISLVDGESTGEKTINFEILKAENAVDIEYVGGEYKVSASHGMGILRYYSDELCTIPIEKPLRYGHYFIRAEVMEDATHLGSVSQALAYDIPLDLRDSVVTITSPSEYRYTGNAITPEVLVKLGSEVIPTTLYTVEYLNNTMPGTATINIKMVDGESIGTSSIDFTILKALNSITIKKVGSEYQLNATHGVGVLKYYSEIECINEITSPTAHGHYFVRGEVVEDETHLGSVSNALPYNIPINLTDCIVSITNPSEYRYTGFEIEPEVLVKLGSEVIDSTLYTVEYLNNTMPGTATINIKMVNGESTGEKSITFEILKAYNAVDIKGSGNSFTATASHGEAVLKYYSDLECTLPIDKPTKYGHYFVRGEVMEDATHLGAVSEALAYDILLNLAECEVTIVNPMEYRYNTLAITPEIKVMLGSDLIPEALYTVEYLNNTMPGTATINIKMVNGESTGERSITFEILKAENAVDIEYVGGEYKIIASHGSGVLKYYSDEFCTIPIAKPTKYGHYFIRAEVVEDETHLGSVSQALAYDIPLNLSDCTVEITNPSEYRYTGYAITPEIKVMLGSEVIPTTLYTVEYLSNIMPGTATINIKLVDGESIGTNSIDFTILKAENAISIEKLGNEYKLTASHGSGVLRYYSDIACKNPINKPTELGNYYIRGEVLEDETHLGATSDVLEYNIVVRENDIWIANTKLEFDGTLADGLAGYKIMIKGDPTSSKNLTSGNQKVLFEGLSPSTAYTIAIYTGGLDTPEYTEYYTKEVTTKDGSTPVLRYSFKSVESQYSKTTYLNYDILIDGLDIYNEYVVDLEATDGYVHTLYLNPLDPNTLSGTIDSLGVGTLNISTAGTLASDSTSVGLEAFTYEFKSIFPRPDTFTRVYTRPTDTSRVIPQIGASDITVSIDLGFTDYDENNFIEAILYDQNNNKYTGDLMGSDDMIYSIPLSVETLRVELLEVISYDGLRYEYNRYTIPGKVVLKEGISTKSIRANKSKGKLDIDFNINMKPDSKAILKNVTAGTSEIITASNMSIALPDVLTAYEYYLEDSGGAMLTDPVSFSVDPSRYNVATADTFIPVEARDVIKTYNSDGTWNMYLYTGFKSTNPNLSYIARVFNDNYNEYYTSKLEYLEVLNLKGDFSLEYFIGEEYNGVYYVADNYKTSLDTMTNKDVYNGFVTTSYNESKNQTTISLKLKDLNVIYDLNNTLVKYGSYDKPTVVTLNEADFTYNSEIKAYCKDIVFSGTTTWWELNINSNSSIKNLDKLEALTTIKGNKFTQVVLKSF